jgi:integrase
VWTIRITPEAGTQKTQEARIVPLHEHLIEQGFLAAIKPRGEGPLFYDPAQERGGRVKPQSVKVGQFLAQWVRKVVGITDPAVQPNHAWRHTFKTICREADIPEGAADYIQGHASKAQGRKYGSNTIPALARELSKFPRYDV